MVQGREGDQVKGRLKSVRGLGNTEVDVMAISARRDQKHMEGA